MYTVTPRERTVTLAGILVALFLGALDQTVVATAMPSILKELNGLNLYTWVVTGYLLASTAMIPIYGKLSDLYGRKAIVLVGTIIFLAGSILSGQARSMVELIAFRAVQGLGSAGIFSTAFTVVADLFPPADRGKFQGLFGGVFGIASIVGPWLGGLLTDALSWRWVFYLNMPIGVVALLLIVLRMPPLKPKLDRAVRIDWWGSATLLVAVVPILLALSLGGTEYPWGSATVLGLFGLGAAGLAAFLLAERRAAEPILPFALFRNRTFVVGTVGALLVNGVAFFGAIIFLPIFMVMVVGVSASAAGLTIMPLTLGVVFSSIVSGQLVSRLGKYKLLLLGGIAVTFTGYLLMNGLRVDMTQREMTWRMVLLGLGIGPALPVFTQAIQNAVQPSDLGTATSSNQFFRQIGATIGIAIFGTIMSTVLAARMPQYLPAEMAGSGAAGGGMSMGELQSGDVNAMEDRITAGLDATYADVEAVLTRGDATARARLLADPNVPAEYRAMLDRGTIADQVKAQLDEQYATIAAALGSGNPGAVKALLGDPRLPKALKDQLETIPPAALSNPRSIPAVLTRVRAGLDAQAPAVVAQATTTTLAAVRSSFDALAARLGAEVSSALKRAFTDAIRRIFFWGLFVIALAFVVTLFLPELPLRGRPAAAGH